MASLIIFVLPLLLYAASLVDARPQYHLEKTAERTGSDWNKRPFHGKGDYYGFLTDEQKRAGPHPDDKYMDFLVGDKRTMEKKNDDAYWDFIGANSKRTNTRKKRSSDGGIRQKANPAGTSVGGGGDSQHPPRGSSHPRRLDPRSGPHDIESWDDFVLGKRPRDENMNFDDFLTGDKRGISDYDYAEFVLGKRP